MIRLKSFMYLYMFMRSCSVPPAVSGYLLTSLSMHAAIS